MKKTSFYFNSIAQNFESWINKFDLATRLEWFASHLDRLKVRGERVLDVGCGLGHFSRLVKERGGYPVPLDIAGRLLSKISHEMPNCVQGNSLELPFQEASFSLVISSECVEHTLDPLGAIREMVRVLKPKGFVILSTPNHAWWWSIIIAEALGIRKFAGIENWPKRHEVKKTLIESGTEILVDNGLYIFPFQLRSLWPLLALINRRGQAFRRWMINQCWVARKL